MVVKSLVVSRKANFKMCESIFMLNLCKVEMYFVVFIYSKCYLYHIFSQNLMSPVFIYSMKFKALYLQSSIKYCHFLYKSV